MNQSCKRPLAHSLLTAATIPAIVATFICTTLALQVSTSAAKHNAQEMFDNQMQAVLTPYLAIHHSLAKDSTAEVKKSAKSIIAFAMVLQGTTKMLNGKHAEHYKDIPKNIIDAAKKLQNASDLKSMRDAYKKLSMPMAMWGTMSKPAGVKVMFCSMAKGSWLQKSAEVRNPYFGADMLGCGEMVGGDSGHHSQNDAHKHH